MRRPKSQTMRNKLDLTDRAQVRLAKKRFRLSENELTNIVARIGNSISAISKQAAVQRANRLARPAEIPAAAIIGSVAITEPNASEAFVPTDPPV
jgi:hypothetical protein